MPKKLTKSKTGFTIIEVVLVLAIAGLIFLMVFLALPALQRSQRDTQRRDDLARFAAQITNYQTNNRGKVPNTALANAGAVWVTTSEHADVTELIGVSTVQTTGDWTNFLNNYMWAANDDFTDPGGTAYAVQDHGNLAKGCSEVKGLSAATASGDSISCDNANNTVTFNISSVDDIIHVFHGAICGTAEGTAEPSTSGGVRKLAFIYKLEGAGYYCGEV